MMKMKWIYILCVPIIVLSVCMAGSVQIMSKAEFPFEVIKGDKSYIDDLCLETKTMFPEGMINIEFKNNKVNYQVNREKNHTTKDDDIYFDFRVIEGSQEGRESLTKEENEEIKSYFPDDDIVALHKLKKASFQYYMNASMIETTDKDHPYFTLQSTDEWMLIEQEIRRECWENNTKSYKIDKDYGLFHKDAESTDYIPFRYMVNPLSSQSGDYILTTRNENVITPSKLYTFTKDEHTYYTFHEVVEFSANRYPIKVVEVEENAFVISRDKNSNFYISLYDKNGKLIKETKMKEKIVIDNYDYLLNSFVNNDYVILRDNQDNHNMVFVIDWRDMKLINTYSTEYFETSRFINASLNDLYFKNDHLYIIENNHHKSPGISIQVMKDKELVFYGILNLVTYKKDAIYENLWDNIPSLNFSSEVKR